MKNTPWNPKRTLWGGLEAVPAPFTTRVKTFERYSFHGSSRGKALLHRSLPIRPIRPPIRPPIHCKKPRREHRSVRINKYYYIISLFLHGSLDQCGFYNGSVNGSVRIGTVRYGSAVRGMSVQHEIAQCILTYKEAFTEYYCLLRGGVAH